MELGGVLNANNIQFQNLGASGQILNAMLQGGIADGTLFAAVATDIGAQIQTVIDRGVPMAQVFALAQPQLQALWEGQQKFGFAVDETTQQLLDQAAAQGIVGPQMQDINKQILDVLLAIGKVLGADIPQAFANLPGAAQASANGINAAFSSVRGPGGFVDSSSLTVDQNLASGGSANVDSMLNSGSTNVVIEQDGRAAAEFIVPHIPDVVNRYRLT
jgi:hypothetical protein